MLLARTGPYVPISFRAKFHGPILFTSARSPLEEEDLAIAFSQPNIHPSIHHTDTGDDAANMILLLLLLPSASAADCFLSSNRSTFPPEPSTPSLPPFSSLPSFRPRWLAATPKGASIVCIGGLLLRGGGDDSAGVAGNADKMLQQPKQTCGSAAVEEEQGGALALPPLLSLSLSPFLTLFHVIMYINSFGRRRSHQSAARSRRIQTSEEGTEGGRSATCCCRRWSGGHAKKGPRSDFRDGGMNIEVSSCGGREQAEEEEEEGEEEEGNSAPW